MRGYSYFQLASMIGRLHDLADQGETSIDASGSIPTPNATDTRINPIETIMVHTMNVRWDASGDVFARSRVGEFFRSSTATLLMGHQFAGRQSSRGRFLPCSIMMSKGEMIGGPSAAAFAAAAAASGLMTMILDQATIATTIPVIATAPMILLISEISILR
jgi:hypothetical protein